ncbi:MAG TPA: quinol:electron acceptor oxidoreductase subunit ActD, partial [Pirellulales bacterium]|nr:quinol:electron acceptor oxidoreductase subunit ActD [Pirellulales bacterium]
MNTKQSLYGLVAEFVDPLALVAATQAVRDEGYRRIEAYTPFPIEDLAEIIGFTKTRVPLVVLIGAIVGCIGGFF